MRNSLLEKIWIWLEICVEDCNEFVVLYIITAHCRLEIPSFVTCTNLTVSVFYVDTLLAPLGYFCLN